MNDWTKDISNEEEKKELGKELLQYVKSGDIIGFGSGSTSYLAAKQIGEYVNKNMISITAVPTSNIIKNLCMKMGLKIKTPDQMNGKEIDWAFDGADEVDKNENLIKGLGGAFLIEKENIKRAKKVYILVDRSKFVEQLGVTCPVPVEVKLENVFSVMDELKKIGAGKVLLRGEGDPYITDNGNCVLDAWFSTIGNDYEIRINKIPGVLENGLLLGYDNLEIITNKNVVDTTLDIEV